MQPDRHYLAYGSNMHLDRMRRRLPDAVVCEAAVLDNYIVGFHKRGRDGSGKCNIAPLQGGRTFGVVYAVTVACLECLDRIEGSGYRRICVQARGVDSGRDYRVYTYIAHEWALTDDLLPEAWYLEYVLQGGRMHRLPDDYIGSLARRGQGGAG